MEIYDMIQKSLDEIEKKNNVRVLLAVESGSRAWGFASPDSDYDVRFIYVQSRDDYLRIDEKSDFIDWQCDEVYDINGWDLKKALFAFGKGNPNLMEWISSPIVYRKSDDWDRIAGAAKKHFSEKASLYHYYGTAKSTYSKFLTGEKVKYKKYFYALRPLLCCKWIDRYHEIPPMQFDELLKLFDGHDSDLSDELLTAINSLVEKKVVTKESDLNDHIPQVIHFIKEELDRRQNCIGKTEQEENKDYSDLNSVFREILNS